MKLWLILALCAVAAAAPSLQEDEVIIPVENTLQVERNLMINMLVRQMIAYVRRVINYGSTIFNIPPLDPLKVESYHLNVPAQLVNLDLNLKNILVSGIGGFVVHTSHLDLATMTFDIKISIPQIDVGAEEYDLIGDLYSAIPLFGKGRAKFQIQNLSFGGKLFLKQSDDGKSILFDRMENARFEIPALKSDLTGVIGGGDIDAVVNAIIEEVVVDYLNRFQAAVASTMSATAISLANPFLNQLDTWRYIAPLIPRRW